MRRILLTGMSGTGKSTALAELASRGLRAVDTDEPGWKEAVVFSECAGARPRRAGRDAGDERLRKTPDEREAILTELAEIEPRLRATCTHELDATRPLREVVADLEAISRGASHVPD